MYFSPKGLISIHGGVIYRTDLKRTLVYLGTDTKTRFPCICPKDLTDWVDDGSAD